MDAIQEIYWNSHQLVPHLKKLGINKPFEHKEIIHDDHIELIFDTILSKIKGADAAAFQLEIGCYDYTIDISKKQISFCMGVDSQ